MVVGGMEVVIVVTGVGVAGGAMSQHHSESIKAELSSWLVHVAKEHSQIAFLMQNKGLHPWPIAYSFGCGQIPR